MVDSKFLRYVPLDQLQTPKSGYEVLVDYWWVIDPEKGALFYQRSTKNQSLGSPQCNRDENVTRNIGSKLYKDMEIRQIHLAYVQRNYD
jgi:hypothetical protein